MGVSTIALATNYLGAFEKKLTLGNLTKDLNENTYSWAGGNAVKVAIPDVLGISDYNRQAGYNTVGYNLTWQTMTLTKDRVIPIEIDEMDDEESKRQAVLGAMSDSAILATEEIDQYVLGTIGANTEISISTSTAALTSGADVYNAIALGEASQINARGRLVDCVLYISATNYMKLKGAMPYRFIETKNADMIFETYDGMKVVIVPDTFLSVGVQFNSTTGFIEAKVYNSTKHQYIDFMIVNKKAVVKPLKLYDNKFIDWKANQNSRANKIILNWYYDCFVLDRYQKAIYIKKQAEA